MNSDLDIIIGYKSKGTSVMTDQESFNMIGEKAKCHQASLHEGNRLRLHLILKDQRLADILKRLPLSDEMEENTELYAYTNEDLWSMEMLGVRPESSTRLDRNPVTMDSRQYVHLVIFGVSNQSESLTIHTALTAHYPNYCKNNTLRTRITLVADSMDDFSHFLQHYRNLLVNSYRRTVKVVGENAECNTIEPKYKGQRRDFVDIEWEFVEGKSDDNVLTYKLQKWAQDEGQQLTIAFCYTDDSRNITEALSLPREVSGVIPVWVNVKDDAVIHFVKQSFQYGNIIPFGMESYTLPDMKLYIQMAQCVNYAYCQMRDTTAEEQRQGLTAMAVATEIPPKEHLQKLWNNRSLNTAKRWSNIYNAFTLRSKMHSLGHPVSEWDTLFSVSDKEVEVMSEVEHNRWCVEELILGYMPTTEKEHQEIMEDIRKRDEMKTVFKHDDLRNFHELGVDATRLPVTRYDAGLIRSLPLIAYTYCQLKGGMDEQAN